MTPDEKFSAPRIARIIRAARKLSGRSQASVAAALGVSQTNFSRFEAGRHIPSVCQWYALCDELKINGRRAIDSGYLDRAAPGVVGTPYPESRFKMPARYANSAGSKVRVARIFLKYLARVYGEEKAWDYVRQLGIDPDLFAVMDHQISIRFSLEMAQMLIERGDLGRESLPVLVSSICSEGIQGKLKQFYLGCESKGQLFKVLFENVNRYEINFSYAMQEENENYIVLADYPSPMMANSNYKNHTIANFLGEYRREWMSQFGLLFDGKPARVELLENQYLGASRCLYKIHL